MVARCAIVDDTTENGKVSLHGRLNVNDLSQYVFYPLLDNPIS